MQNEKRIEERGEGEKVYVSGESGLVLADDILPCPYETELLGA